MAREGDDPNATTLTGDLTVVFGEHSNETFTVKTTVTIQDEKTLDVTFEKWPFWAKNGRFRGTRTQKDLWRRSDK